MAKVSIIEDDVQVAEGLKFSINFQKGYEVVSVYASAEDASYKIKEDEPDIILLDVYLPKMNGIDFLPALQTLCPESSIIMLTSSNEVQNIFDALKAGAIGYLLKNASISEIISALESVQKGGSPLSENVARKIVTSFRVPDSDYELTNREKVILRLLCAGKSRKEIGAELFIEVSTVKFHLSKLFKKMGVSSQTEATVKAIRENLI